MWAHDCEECAYVDKRSYEHPCRECEESSGDKVMFKGKNEANKKYSKIAKEIAKLVTEKQIAYGDSFENAEKVIKVLYPEGINPEQYKDALTMIRVIDKLFRIANKKDAFGESPWRDIMGYALLSVEREERENDK